MMHAAIVTKAGNAVFTNSMQPQAPLSRISTQEFCRWNFRHGKLEKQMEPQIFSTDQCMDVEVGGLGGFSPPVFAKFSQNLPFSPQILAILCLQLPHFSVSPCTFEFTPTSIQWNCRIRWLFIQTSVGSRVLRGNKPYLNIFRQQKFRHSYTDDAIILLNFIFTGLHGYQITPSLSTNKQRHGYLLHQPIFK